MTSTSSAPGAADTSLAGRLSQAGLWPIRVLWFLLPVLVGPGLLAAVDGRSDAVQATVEYGAWLAWFVGLVCVLAPSTVTLTILRCLAPAAVAAPLLGAVLNGIWTSPVLIALGAGLLVAAVVFLPSTGDPMINGSAYGSERRMALRPPAAIVVGPMQIAWLLVFGGVITGPLLVASGRWIIGAVATVAGFALAVIGVRSLHQLSRRWIVFVPAGFVIHDYWTLAESLLVQRRTRPTLGAAHPGEDALDLTAGSAGLALAITLPDPLPYARKKRTKLTGGEVESGTADQFWFSPTLPGLVLSEARVRAISID